MLKPLLYILIIVILLALAIELNLFKTTKDTLTNSSTKILVETKTSNSNIFSNKDNIDVNLTKITINSSDDNLSRELIQLENNATKYFQKSEDTEAFRLYDEIIEKSKNSTNPKILNAFIKATFAKALLQNIYPHNDPEAAIETYETIVSKFETSTNINLLRSYIQAKLAASRLLSKDELITAYDELISKFEKDKEHRFDTEVEEFLFAKSFALMDEHAEEAMDVLDNIISNYQKDGKKKLPETVHISILNNIELAIITNNSEDEYVDLANKYLSEDKGTKPLLDMLNIIKNAQDINQDDAIIEWFNKHEGYHFPDWDFNELAKWANNMERKERQERILQYLEVFKKQKENRSYPAPTIYSSSDGTIEEINEDSNSIIYEPTDENIYESSDPYDYEPDPYLNDIYEQPTYQENEYIQYADPYANTTEPYSSSSENNIYDSPAYAPEY